MQIKQRQRMVELNISTIHVHINMISIKLGTIVHLRTCVVWLISLFWWSCYYRINLIRTSCRSSLFSLSTSCRNAHRRLVLRWARVWPFFWSHEGSKFRRIRRKTPTLLSLYASTSFQLIFPRVLRVVSVPLMGASLARDWLWMIRRIEDLFQGFVKRW